MVEVQQVVKYRGPNLFHKNVYAQIFLVDFIMSGTFAMAASLSYIARQLFGPVCALHSRIPRHIHIVLK